MNAFASAVARPITAQGSDKSHYFYIAKTVLSAGTSVLEPLILNQTLKREKTVSSEERRIIVFQDALRQGISFGISTLTFVGGGLLAGTVLKHHQDRGVIGLISGMVVEKFLGKLLLKPLLTSKLTAWWHTHYPESQYHAPKPPVTGSEVSFSSPSSALLQAPQASPSLVYPETVLKRRPVTDAMAGGFPQPLTL
ncbi:MAG: hypothetical protein ACKO37_10330 [Vampirovibrionales bacterium]